MLTKIQYNLDDSGQKTSVIVPYRKWQEMNNQLEQLKFQLQVFKSIQDGITEVKQARKTGKTLQSLADFIHESRS